MKYAPNKKTKTLTIANMGKNENYSDVCMERVLKIKSTINLDTQQPWVPVLVLLEVTLCLRLCGGSSTAPFIITYTSSLLD